MHPHPQAFASCVLQAAAAVNCVYGLQSAGALPDEDTCIRIRQPKSIFMELVLHSAAVTWNAAQ